MHRKHGIDPGTEGSRAWGGYPGGVLSAPSPEKLGFSPKMAHFGAFGFIQEFIWKSYNVRTPNTIVLPLIFGIWFGVFPISTAHIGLFNCSQPPKVPTVDCRNRVVYPSFYHEPASNTSSDTENASDVVE